MYRCDVTSFSSGTQPYLKQPWIDSISQGAKATTVTVTDISTDDNVVNYAHVNTPCVQ